MSEPDLYFSVDVESDGPIPGIYSMLSFGLVVAGRFDGERLERPDREPPSFYRELKPLSDEFVAEAVAVTGLDDIESGEYTRSPPDRSGEFDHPIRLVEFDTQGDGEGCTW